MTINWEAHYNALQKRNSKPTKVEQLAGNDLGFWASMGDLHENKFKDLAEAVLLDIRYKMRFEYEKEILVRLGIESFVRAVMACSAEEKKPKEVKKEPNQINNDKFKLKI